MNVTNIAERSEDAEVNNVIYMEKRAMRMNYLKFGAMMVLVAMLTTAIFYVSLVVAPFGFSF